jgi:peptide/nickel transport system substrate-binding protein
MSRTFATDIITDGPTYQIQDFNIPTDSSGNSAYAGPYKKTGQDLYDKAVTCSGMTLTVHLNKPVGDFNQYATYPAMSPVKESVDQNSATGGANYDKRPWALGPYKIKEYSVGNQLVMVRNSQWNKASDPIRNAYPDTVQMRFSVAQDTRDQIFLNDSVPNAVNYDQGLQPVNNVAFFKDYKNSSRGMNTGSPYTRYEAFNVSKGHMDCLDVRKAIFFAFPNKAMIDLSGGTRFYGNMTDSPVNPLLATDYAATTGNIHDSNFKLAGNPTYAKQLLAAAKTSCPATYARVTDPNKGFSIDLPNTSTQQKAAALIKPAMAKAGLTVTFNFINSGTYYSTVQNPAKQGDLSRAGWAADWANASTVIPDLFLKDGGFDLTQNWTDPVYADFEKKVIAAQSETNRATQAADWKALSQFVMDQYWLNFPIANREQNQWGSKVGGADFWMPQGSLLFPALYVKA